MEPLATLSRRQVVTCARWLTASTPLASDASERHLLDAWVDGQITLAHLVTLADQHRCPPLLPVERALTESARASFASPVAG